MDPKKTGAPAQTPVTQNAAQEPTALVAPRLIRKEGSQAPTQTYWGGTCTVTRALQDSNEQESLESTVLTLSIWQSDYWPYIYSNETHSLMLPTLCTGKLTTLVLWPLRFFCKVTWQNMGTTYISWHCLYSWLINCTVASEQKQQVSDLLGPT